MGEPRRPHPRDYVDLEDYNAAMEAYLAKIGVDPDKSVEEGAMDAFRAWREDPPENGWQ